MIKTDKEKLEIAIRTLNDCRDSISQKVLILKSAGLFEYALMFIGKINKTLEDINNE